MSADDDKTRAAIPLRDHIPGADPRWVALARGELAEGEAESLRREALAGGPNARAYEAFRPLDDAEREQLTSALLAKVAPPKQKPLLRRRITLAVAAAAVLLCVVLVVVLRTSSPSLPQYVASVELIEATRAVPEAFSLGVLVEARPGSRLRMKLRPESDVKDPIAARVFVTASPSPEAKSFLARPWPAALEQHPHGGISVEGSLDEARTLAAASSTFTVVVVIGPAGALPDDASLLALLEAPSSDALQRRFRVVRVDVHIRDTR